MEITNLPGDCINEIAGFLRCDIHKTLQYNTHISLFNFILTCKFFYESCLFTIKSVKPLCCFTLNYKPCKEICYQYENVYNLKKKTGLQKKRLL